jgi:AraC family transcriptional regulator
MRARLRDAAVRLVDEPAKIVDIALDSGFGDVSNFNRAFRTEFGVSPTRYRQSGSREAGLHPRR